MDTRMAELCRQDGYTDGRTVQTRWIQDSRTVRKGWDGYSLKHYTRNSGHVLLFKIKMEFPVIHKTFNRYCKDMTV